MAGTKEIKRRIVSVKNTKKITKAMELVAASKMKRAVNSTMASRLYAKYSWEVLTSISESLKDNTNLFFKQREIKNSLIILITSNRGLCGAYNAQITKKVLLDLKFEKELKDKSIKIDFITIGKKGDLAMRRLNQNIIASFLDLPDNISISDVTPISNFAITEFNLEHYDNIRVAYTDYVSALTQKANIKTILPISKELTQEISRQISEQIHSSGSTAGSKTDYLFEGDFDTLLESLANKITRMQIYQMLLESNASEQSSRMIAMKNATDASGEMIDDLTLVFNKARQANITREISEISAGMTNVS